MSKVVCRADIVKCCGDALGGVLHVKQVKSIASAVLGAMEATRLGSAEVGRSLAAATRLVPKHAIKQVDRMLGNTKIDTGACQEQYVRWLVGQRRRIEVSLDWTEYGLSKQNRISLNIVTSHGRATPLLWRTYRTAGLKNRRTGYEHELIRWLHSILEPQGVHVTMLADRGFADNRLYDLIHGQLRWDFVIRFRSDMWVTAANGECRKARDWIAYNGHARKLDDAQVGANGSPRRSVVFVKKQDMAEPWNLVSSLGVGADDIVQLYARRFTCEEQYRDEKDNRFGMGSRETRVSTTARRDRWVLINALVTVLLTLLGAAAEMIGYDRRVRANTLHTRTHSLFRLGRECIRGVARRYFQPLCDEFARQLLRRAAITAPNAYV